MRAQIIAQLQDEIQQLKLQEQVIVHKIAALRKTIVDLEWEEQLDLSTAGTPSDSERVRETKIPVRVQD